MAGMGSFITANKLTGAGLAIESTALLFQFDYNKRAAKIDRMNAETASKVNNARRLGEQAQVIDAAAQALSASVVIQARPGVVNAGITPEVSRLLAEVRHKERLDAAATQYDLANLLAGAHGASAARAGALANAGTAALGNTAQAGRITGAFGTNTAGA